MANSPHAMVWEILDYTYPLTVSVYFLFATTYASCSLQKPKASTRIARLRLLALCLLLAATFTYAAQGVLYIVRTLAQRGWWAPDHSIILVLSSILVWSCFYGVLLVSEKPLWHPHLGMWTLGLIFEVAICVVSSEGLDAGSVYKKIRFAISAIRLLCFAALVVVGSVLCACRNEEKGTDEEQQSLLAPNGPNATEDNASYGSIGSEDTATPAEETDDNKEIKEAQRKRLEEQGGWWGYLKGFFVFVPYMWPRGKPKLQFCILIMIIDLIIDRFLNVLTPRQVGIITDKLSENAGKGIFPSKELFIWIALGFLGSSAGFSVLKDIAQIRVQNFARAQISDLAFDHVMSLSMDFHGNKDSGELIRAMEQAQSLNDLIELVLLEIAPVFIDLVVAMAFVTHLFDVYVGFIIVVVGVLYTWCGIVFTNYIRPMRSSYRDKQRAEGKTIFESISNWQTVSYFNRNIYERSRYGNAVGEACQSENQYYTWACLGWSAQALIMTLGLLTASFRAVYTIVYGDKPIGNFVTLLLYWGTLSYPLHMVANSYRRVSTVLIDAERLLQLLTTKPTVTDRQLATELVVSKGEVEFSDVEFSYDDRKQTLKNINFTAKPGKTIAFVGETGGGKSTTLKLLFRFYDVKGGSIKIDGQDIRDVTLESLRESLGMVPQDPSLFNQSVLDNVRYAKLDATDEEIHEACRAAAVHDKIITFPDGYASKVGERGVKLSGGELQRVAIARIILKNPKIVMLDEATSAVDSSTEATIQEAFRKLSAGRTTFVIAHRLSTIMDADLILVIDQGEIVERGTHSELLKKGGKYTELWTKQTEGKKSKPVSVNGEATKDGKEPLVLLNDIPTETYTEQLAKAMSAEDKDIEGEGSGNSSDTATEQPKK